MKGNGSREVDSFEVIESGSLTVEPLGTFFFRMQCSEKNQYSLSTRYFKL
jgi:hypothetical protein